MNQVSIWKPTQVAGAHSQASIVAEDLTEVVRSARYDTSDFDVLSD